MIVSFGDKGTEALYHRWDSRDVKRYPSEIMNAALRKMDILNSAHDLRDLQSPPGNHLEALKGTLQGYHSIRINKQWRIVFIWQLTDAHEVRIVDYH
jgi:proteic killer suppression protein